MLLTISIPTYNRAIYLKKLLDSIYKENLALVGFFEVCISDNCSTDETADLFKIYSLSYDNLRYFRNNNNIGANRNIAIASGLGTGDYVWILGDDELLTPGSLAEIIRYLCTGLDYIMLNHSVHDEDMNVVKIKKWNNIDSDINLHGRSIAMRFLGPSPSFISAIVARRFILNSMDAVLIEKYIHLGFNQLYSFYKGLPEDAHGIATEKVLLNARGNASAVSYDWNHYFVTGLGIIFRDLMKIEGYSYRDVRYALAAVISRYHINRALNESAEGRSRRQLRRLAYSYYSDQWLFWVVFIPITFLPSFIMRPVKKMRQRIRA